MVESIYVDSNAFILPVVGEDSQRAKGALSLLRMIEAGRLEAFTSILTWDEVCWVITRVLGKADGVAAGKKILSFPNLRFVDANSAVVSTAQSLLERYSSKGLAPRDAIHCASSMTRKAALIASDDGGLDVVKEVRRTPLEGFLDSPAGTPDL
jgi:predicted nucleic acid-binding protein